MTSRNTRVFVKSAPSLAWLREALPCCHERHFYVKVPFPSTLLSVFFQSYLRVVIWEIKLKVSNSSVDRTSFRVQVTSLVVIHFLHPEQ